MQLLCILLAANRDTVNFQAFLASDCLVTIYVFVFFNICICILRYLYFLDILAVHALLGNKTPNHSSASPLLAFQNRILHFFYLYNTWLYHYYLALPHAWLSNGRSDISLILILYLIVTLDCIIIQLFPPPGFPKLDPATSSPIVLERACRRRLFANQMHQLSKASPLRWNRDRISRR